MIIKGRLYDKITQNPITKANIELLGIGGINNFNIQDNGIFEFELELTQIPNINAPEVNNIDLPSKIIITSSNYIPKQISLLTQNGDIKKELGTIGMLNFEEKAKIAEIELKNQTNDVILKAQNITQEPFEKIKVTQRRVISKQISKTQNLIFPILLTLLFSFGVSSINDTSKYTCPNPQILNSNIRRRNNVSRQVNQIFRQIITNALLAYVFIRISTLFKKLNLNISNIPLPLGSPLGVGVPYNLVSKLQGLEDLTEELEKQNKDLSKQLIISLVFLIATLILILLLLRKLDELNQKCVEETGIDTEELVEINPELSSLLGENKKSTNPEDVPVIVNGFTIEVIDFKEVGSINKRQAVAKNSQGVIQLKGEPSFSSNDEILINELEFIIKSQDLKAF